MPTARQKEKLRATDAPSKTAAGDGDKLVHSSRGGSGARRPLLTATTLLLLALALALSSLEGVHATPATLPSLHEIHVRRPLPTRNQFIPCIERYNVSTTPYQRVASHSASSSTSDEQIAFITPYSNSTETYWDASQSDNLIFHFHPEAIVYPRDSAQVSHVVACAAQHGNIAVAARSGGHSFAGYGSGGQDGSVIIDMLHLSDIHADSAHSWADVGPGARLGDVVKALWRDGRRAMPHGTCPTVGVGGHALCGGFGPSSRAWGLATDSMLEADVVLADGSIVTASRDSHPELLWALKGAGHFYGIVTRFRFRTQDASSPMTFLEYKWTKSIVGPDPIVDTVDAVQRWVADPSFPAGLGFHIQMGPASSIDRNAGLDNTLQTPQFTLHLRGMFLHPLAQYKPWADKLRTELRARGVPVPDYSDERAVDWLQLNQLWDDFGTQDHKLDTFAERLVHNKFVAKTVLSLDHRKPLLRDALRQTAQLMWDWMLKTWGLPRRWSWNVYFEMTGGSNVKYRDDAELVRASAFPHRDTLWLIQASVGTSPTGTIEPRAYTLIHQLEDSFRNAIAVSGSTPVAYGCYTDGDKTRSGAWKHDYYGDNVPKLEALKHQLDPTNLFRNPQTFGAASTSDDAEASQNSIVTHPLPR